MRESAHAEFFVRADRPRQCSDSLWCGEIGDKEVIVYQLATQTSVVRKRNARACGCSFAYNVRVDASGTTAVASLNRCKTGNAAVSCTNEGRRL